MALAGKIVKEIDAWNTEESGVTPKTIEVKESDLAGYWMPIITCKCATCGKDVVRTNRVIYVICMACWAEKIKNEPRYTINND